MRRFSWWVVGVMVFSLLVSCGPAVPGPCDKDQVQAASQQLKDVIGQWQDAYKVASSTGRIGLAAPVQSLQTIKRQVEALEVPPCLVTARGYLAEHMNYTVDGFLAFMAQESDTAVQNKFNNAGTLLTQYTDEMNRIAACMPECK